jgi:hypothetical protein
MMKHQIKVAIVEDYAFEHEIASSHGKGANKSLKAVVSQGAVRYEVLSQKAVICETGSVLEAVEAYNNAI